MLIKAASNFTLVTQTVAFSTGCTILSHIVALSTFNADLAFHHLHPFLARRVLGHIIFDEVMQKVICISFTAEYIFTGCNGEGAQKCW
jgi:hypothetical protein